MIQIFVDDLIQSPENDYDGVLDAVFESKTTFEKTEKLLKDVKRLIELKEIEVFCLEDLLIKYCFHGLRASNHNECNEDECLLFCNVCCADPKYPCNKRGSIKIGLVVKKYDYKKDKQMMTSWRSTKQICAEHFFKNELHFRNLNCNKDKWKKNYIEAQLNQFRVALRLSNSNQGDIQYPKEIAMLNKMNVNVGNIGHGRDKCRKLRKYLSSEVFLHLHAFRCNSAF